MHRFQHHWRPASYHCRHYRIDISIQLHHLRYHKKARRGLVSTVHDLGRHLGGHLPLAIRDLELLRLHALCNGLFKPVIRSVCWDYILQYVWLLVDATS